MKLTKKKKHDDKDKKGKNKRTFNYSGKLGNMEKSCWNNINEWENKVKKLEAYMTHVIEQSPTLISKRYGIHYIFFYMIGFPTCPHYLE